MSMEGGKAESKYGEADSAARELFLKIGLTPQAAEYVTRLARAGADVSWQYLLFQYYEWLLLRFIACSSVFCL